MIKASSAQRALGPKRTKRGVVQLRISLSEINPAVWRRVLVIDSTTLHELHRVIQLLFDWLDYHRYEFEAKSGGMKRRRGGPRPGLHKSSALVSRITAG